MISFRSRLVFTAACDGHDCALGRRDLEGYEDLASLVEWLGRTAWIVRGFEAYCPRCVSLKRHLNNGADDG